MSRMLFAVGLGLMFLSSQAYAQEASVTGTIKDADSGDPIPGVNVVIKGASTGTVTDIDGNYTISVDKNAILIVSFVGYETMEIAVGSQSNLDISMTFDISQLGEVVVVGYGEIKKEDLTGAVSVISEKDFNKGNIGSAQQLLTGRVAGVSVVSSGGQPGAGSTIRIRRGSSISASNDPLIIIDGVITSNEGAAGLSNALSTINPNDIESMTVLKDASATAIYGSRASNGVIIVKTKSGSVDKPLTISFSTQASYGILPNRVDVLSADQFRTLIDARADAGDLVIPAAAQALYGTANTDWQDEVLQGAFGTDNNISVLGAIKNVPFRFSYGNYNQNGAIKTSNFNRNTFALKVDPSLLDDHLKINVNLKGSFIKNRFADTGALGAAITFDPTQEVRDPSSPWGGFTYWPQAGDPSIPNTIATTNPVMMIELNDDRSNIQEYTAGARFDYKMHFMPKLKAVLNLSTVRTASDGNRTRTDQNTQTFNGGNNGRINDYNSALTNDLLEFYLNYNTELGAKSQLDLIGGYSWQHFTRERDNLETRTDRTDTVGVPGFSKSENYLVSFFGRANYSYNNKYLLTASVRYDGSSRFIDPNQWGFFPSVAVAWKIKEEGFLQNVKAISQLKLRAGYGVTGQENLNDNYYPALSVVSFSENNARYNLGGTYFNMIRFDGFDPDLKWEETSTINIGLDFGLWKNRITGSLEWYKRTTNDMLNTIPVTIGSNFTNELLTNVGSMEINGIELGLNALVVENDDFAWNFGYNFTFNENKITKLLDVDDPNYIGVPLGGISGGAASRIQINQVGASPFSFLVFEQVYDENGVPIEGVYIDQDNDGLITDADKVPYKNALSDFMMGFSSLFTYKDFSFSFNARLNLNNYVYNNVSSIYGTYENVYNTTGYINNVTSDVADADFNAPQFFTDYYVTDASFFRMDNMTLGYNVGNLFTEKVNLRVNFTVQNAFVITDYKGLDPEISNGIDNNLFPRTRTYALGLLFNFIK